MTVTSDAVGLGPIVQALTPYAVAIVGAVLTWAVSLAIAAFQRWTGVKIDETYRQQFEAAAATEAGKLIAGAADNLATASFPVGSPIVAAAAKRLFDAPHLQAAIAALSMTPARAAAIVTGELGKLQAQMTKVTPAKA